MRACVYGNTGVLARLEDSPLVSCGYTVMLLSLHVNDVSLTSRVHCLLMLEFVILTVSTFFLTVCFGAVSRYGSAKIRFESDHIGLIGPWFVEFVLQDLGADRWTISTDGRV